MTRPDFPSLAQLQRIETSEDSVETRSEFTALLLKTLQLRVCLGQSLVAVAQLFAELILLSTYLFVVLDEFADLGFQEFQTIQRHRFTKLKQ